MWDLIEKINALRNKLSQSLDGEPRAKAMEALRTASEREVGEKLGADEAQDARIWLASPRSMCLGFVHSFELEVGALQRLRCHDGPRRQSAPAFKEVGLAADLLVGRHAGWVVGPARNLRHD